MRRGAWLLLLQLSESLRSNSSITSVNLSSNHIGTEGVQVGTAVAVGAGSCILSALACDKQQCSYRSRACLLAPTCMLAQAMMAVAHVPAYGPVLTTPFHAVVCCAVQALVDALQQGGCSELISLDLRGNTLSPEAEALLVS